MRVNVGHFILCEFINLFFFFFEKNWCGNNFLSEIACEFNFLFLFFLQCPGSIGSVNFIFVFMLCIVFIRSSHTDALASHG